MMNYKIEVNEVNNDSNLKGFANVVFGDAYKVSNIAIKESKNGLYLDMPSHKTNKKDDDGKIVYDNIFHPITSEFANELKENIIKAYESEEKELSVGNIGEDMKFEASSHPLSREDKMRGIASLYIEDSFVVKNIAIIEGENGLFVSNPTIKTKKTDSEDNPVYRDIAYPITAEARENIYGKIINDYNERLVAQEQKPKTK